MVLFLSWVFVQAANIGIDDNFHSFIFTICRFSLAIQIKCFGAKLLSITDQIVHYEMVKFLKWLNCSFANPNFGMMFIFNFDSMLYCRIKVDTENYTSLGAFRLKYFEKTGMKKLCWRSVCFFMVSRRVVVNSWHCRVFFRKWSHISECEV